MLSPLTAAATGAIAGLGIAMPLGAIGVLIIRLGMTRGFRAAAAAALGTATVDGTYCAFAMLAGAGLAGTVASWGNAPVYVSGAVVVAIGIVQLVQTFRGPGGPQSGAPPSSRSVYARFVSLTALNPVTVVYFVALAGALAGHQTDTTSRLAFILGAGAGSAAWGLTLAAGGALLHRAATPRTTHMLGVAGSLVVIGLGAALLIRAALG